MRHGQFNTAAFILTLSAVLAACAHWVYAFYILAFCVVVYLRKINNSLKNRG